ncbi:hypothetical protein G9H64_06700 [Aquirufa nivalisilvae]|jgi:hypothetical protein|uniref:Lipoprotein n=1 Tax=Aquirufa nivalisilvae TaxID=2516557 RepID=A0A2S2DWQ8_9BACT|nr:hypothetical protein [Aquirufa nivalisilvae]AWL09783.1 hypothetical protein HME7025_01933 [Aquirufa nivalisilvae]MCZ2480407.1 hypothetical protein [Aquirufa nivalisilvae]MCZ2482640.1 hypothetical protein [Aquirufa nivalisilvae]
MKNNLIVLALTLFIASCSHKGAYFAVYQQAQPTTKAIVSPVKAEEPQLLVSQSNELSEEILPIQANTPEEAKLITELTALNQEVKSMKHMEKKELIQHKKAFKAQLKTQIKEYKAQAKKQKQASSPSSWDSKVKIGVILLIIGIILSIFGLGAIGAVSAFIGLIFVLLGLLHTF